MAYSPAHLKAKQEALGKAAEFAMVSGVCLHGSNQFQNLGGKDQKA